MTDEQEWVVKIPVKKNSSLYVRQYTPGHLRLGYKLKEAVTFSNKRAADLTASKIPNIIGMEAVVIDITPLKV